MSGGGDEDAWLYGDEEGGGGVAPPGEGEEEGDGGAHLSTTDAPGPGGDVNGEANKPMDTSTNAVLGQNGDEHLQERQDAEGGAGAQPQEEEDNSDSDDDDDIVISIDKDKIEAAKTSYQNLQLKKAAGHEFAEKKKGKFAVEEFDQVGAINGESAVEFDMESLEDKPWRKPGADITDYFNYGFTEETWTAYCNRQKSLRGNEAGVSVLPQAPIITAGKSLNTAGGSQVTVLQPPFMSNIPILGSGELATAAAKKGGPMKISSTLKQVEPTKQEPSGITVMTHDKRIYSNKVLSNMDFSLPPPSMGSGGFSMPPPTVLGGSGTVEPSPASAGAATVQPIVTSTAAGTGAAPTDEFNAADFPSSEFPPAEAFGEDPFAAAANYEPTAEAQWSQPPPNHHYNTSLPPPSMQQPPPHFTGAPPPSVPGTDPSRYSSSSSSLRDSRDRDREDRYRRDYDRDRRSSRRRSRSRDRDRDRRDRDRYSDSRGGDRDRTRIKRERRSRSRSRSPPRSHKKSRSDRDRRRDSAERDEGPVKIKEEPEDSAPVAPPGEN
eukprot:TRINITY_DN6925_c0_g1_i6.p1 TRINITY_DN6925_c0_g1~~TRINITY_DN6925_c0_g1_i6.p1  ORF type:complete len:549 (-),score=197.39 TRINITY_DN6925_c0_g1_i6:78-1724(-)